MTKTTIILDRPAESKIELTSIQKKTAGLELPPVKSLSWVEKVLCRGLRIHRGKWVYMAEAECRQVTVCQRCGKTRVRTKHQHKWVYLADSRKNWPDRFCSLCEKTYAGPSMLRWHQKSTHGIDSIIPSGPDTCAQQRICKRCGEAREGLRIQHEWGPAYTVDNSTDGHDCWRCGKKETWSTADCD
jgi:hypothetical protein